MAALLGSAFRPAAAADRPLRVVASFSILADLAAQVAGPVAEVSALVGPDADAHVFQPSPADVRRLAQADLVIVNGLGFEGWMTRLIGSAGYRGPVLTCSDGLKPAPRRSRPDRIMLVTPMLMVMAPPRRRRCARSACLAGHRQRPPLCGAHPRCAGDGAAGPGRAAAPPRRGLRCRTGGAGPAHSRRLRHAGAAAAPGGQLA